MALIGIIVWFLLGEFELGLSWVLIGLCWCCTVVGIPFGIACFRIAEAALAPLGKRVLPREDIELIARVRP